MEYGRLKGLQEQYPMTSSPKTEEHMRILVISDLHFGVFESSINLPAVRSNLKVPLKIVFFPCNNS